MKNAFKVFLSILFVLGFISCNQITGENTGSVSFSADDIIKSVSRNGNEASAFKISIKLTGAISKEESRFISIGDIGTEKTKFEFDNVPVEKPLHISVEVSSAGTIIYEGSSDIENVKSGSNNVRLGLNYRNRYVLWNRGRDFIGSSAGLFENINGNIDFSHSLASLLTDDRTEFVDFYFDRHKNLYVLEFKNGQEGEKIAVKRFSYACPEKPVEIFSQSLNSADSSGGVFPCCIAADDYYVYLALEENGRSFVKKINISDSSSEDIMLKTEPSERDSRIIAMEIGENGTLYIAVYGTKSEIKQISGKGDEIQKVALEIPGINGVIMSLDLQLEGNYLYALCMVQNGGMPLGGGVLPINISGNNLLLEKIAGYDSTGKSYIRESEYISPDFLYGPSKFVARENGKLIISDDGLYFLEKPGYESISGAGQADRNVNRVVSLSLSTPDVPKIESIINLGNITFDNDAQEEKFIFNPPYFIHGKSSDSQNIFYTVLKEQDVLNDTIGAVPVVRTEGNEITDWYIDDNYNIYILDNLYNDADYTNTERILKYSFNSVTFEDNKPEWFYESSDSGINNIAVSGNYIYFDKQISNPASGNTYTINRIDYTKTEKNPEELFILDSGQKFDFKVTALEADSDSNVFIAVSYDDINNQYKPIKEILKYSNNILGATITVPIEIMSSDSAIEDDIKEKIIVSDLLIKGDKLYALIRLINAPNGIDGNGYSKGCLYTIDLQANRFTLGAPIGLLEGHKSDKIPSNSIPDFFYGPYKFVAVKPDELVIADDGWYGEKQNTNSIVKMKLENGIPKFASRHIMPAETGYNFSGEIDPNGCGFY